MQVKAGKMVLPNGAGLADPAIGWSVTGIGFKPQAILFIWCDSDTEDVWTADTSSAVLGGMGIACEINSEDPQPGPAGTGIGNSCTMNIWSGQQPGCSSSLRVCAIAREEMSSTVGWAFSVRSFDSDGFTCRYAQIPESNYLGYGLPSIPYQDGATGKIVYYLALADIQVAHNPLHILTADGSEVLDLGWLPRGVVETTGAGPSWLELDFDSYGFQIFDDATDSVEKSLWISKGLGPRNMFILGRIDGDWWDFQASSVVYNNGSRWKQFYGYDNFSYTGPATKYGEWLTQGVDSITNRWHWDWVDGGSHMDTNLGQMVYGDLAVSDIGSIDLDPDVGDTHLQTLNIHPEALVIMSSANGPYYKYGFTWWTDGVRIGQTSIGFVTDDFQCVVCWGGGIRQNGGRFQSSSAAWVSNCVNPGAWGTVKTYGDANLIWDGFEYTMLYHDSGFPGKIAYWALGDALPNGPRLVSLQGQYPLVGGV